MPAILGTILAFIVESTLARVLWASISWWFMMGLIPVVISAINGATGNPLGLIPEGCWWMLDVSGFDILFNGAMSALMIRFIIRRLPK